jgi:predicted heme/steroid binding protein
MKKQGQVILIVLLVLLLMTGCTPKQAAQSTDEDQLVLTLEELAKYNGKDGQPAYVAVDGVIYDVSNKPAWKNGEHNGYSAGQDLTEIIKTKSPHGVSKLSGLPVVGKLAE